MVTMMIQTGMLHDLLGREVAHVQHYRRQEHDDRAVEPELAPGLDHLRHPESRPLHRVQRGERQPQEHPQEHRDERPEHIQPEENREPAEHEVKHIRISGEPQRELPADLTAPLVIGDDVNRVRLDLAPNRPAADLLRHLSHPWPLPWVSPSVTTTAVATHISRSRYAWRYS
jgi:hypothetical protein